jgi:hypothetical protein
MSQKATKTLPFSGFSNYHAKQQSKGVKSIHSKRLIVVVGA